MLNILKLKKDIKKYRQDLSSELDQLTRNIEKYAMLSSPDISAQQHKRLANRMDKISMCIMQRESYIEKSKIDNAIFGTFWGREYFDNIAGKLMNGDKGMYDRLRLIYNFSGFPIVNYRRIETFPIVDPVYQRYLKLYSVSPENFRITSPAICGEAGWKVADGVVNQDVAVTQERLLYLYFSGAYDHLISKSPQPTIFEMGAGCGLFAYGMNKVFSKCRYFICDVPESLIISYSYLNLALPNTKHYVASPEGLFEIGDNNKDRLINIEDIGEGVVYVPNYMMHIYDKLIKADMAFNAMSLHEMQSKQIEYYTGILANNILSGKDTFSKPGFFFEVNAHKGERNSINSPYLNSNFKHCKSFDFYDLSLSPALWTNDKSVFDDINMKFESNMKKYDLDKLFQIDLPYQYPSSDFLMMQQLMDEDIGNYIGISIKDWMDRNKYDFADNLGGYRRRFLG